jgi:shikimate kinase
MKNIILIGMPGSGKSTLGVLLAKQKCFDFLDTDIYLQSCLGKSLADIMAAEGLEQFCKIEEELLCQIQCERTVIATGGSAVYYECAMDHLKHLGTRIFLEITLPCLKPRLGDLKARGVVIPDGMSLDTLYSERQSLYEKNADLIINCDHKSCEELIQEIMVYLEDSKSC